MNTTLCPRPPILSFSSPNADRFLTHMAMSRRVQQSGGVDPLTWASRRLENAAAARAFARNQRIRHLKQAVADGSYQPDPTEVARILLDMRIVEASAAPAA